MAAYRFKQVDVFGRTPFRGNPVAVVLEADALDAAQMQAIAAWTNLSETTFVQRPTSAAADYRLRIFTPTGELPFAGHPTVGSAHAVLEAGIVPPEAPTFRQECGAGILPITVSSNGSERQIFTRVPAASIGEPRGRVPDLVQRLSAALGRPVSADPAPLAVDVGPVWLIAYLAEAGAVGRVTPDQAAVTALSHELGLTGVTVFGPSSVGGAAIEVRSFAPLAGVQEDPVCGSGNASVAAFLAETGRLSEIGSDYVAAQGMALGRDGRVAVRVRDGAAWIEIGGSATTLIEGTIQI